MRKRIQSMSRKENRIGFKRLFAFVLTFVAIVLFSCGLNFTVKAEEQKEDSIAGEYTIYFDINDHEDAFAENGVGVYAYSSESESYRSTPVAMYKSDKGEGIYEYSFDKPYKYIAFMNGYDSWDYEIATSPVYTEWEYESPCFLLDEIKEKESKGLWRNLNCVVYFDASEIKEDESFIENGVYIYAYNEDGDEYSETPVEMITSDEGENFYEYTLHKPYEYVQFILGDSFDAEIKSEVITIDWLEYAQPCYKMNLDRKEKIPDESDGEKDADISISSNEILESETLETETTTESVEITTEASKETAEISIEINTDEETEETTTQPIEKASAATHKLSVVFDVYKMKWLGTENTDEINVKTLSMDETISTVSVDGELTDLGDSATKSTRSADIALASTSSDTRTIYFDTCKNNGSNGWTTDMSPVYIHVDGVTSVPIAMTKSTRICSHGNETLWEYEIPIDCALVVFSMKGSWTTSGTDYSGQTVDVVFANEGIDADDLYVCFGLDGGSGTNGKKTVDYLGDLGPLSQAGKSMYFCDMTSTITGEVIAVFENENTSESSLPVTVSVDTNGAYMIPADETDNNVDYPYTTVTFQMKNEDGTTTQLGETYNFFNDSSSGNSKFLYNETTTNTYYYGTTEKKSDKNVISFWGGVEPTGTGSLAGKTLYFDKLFFPVEDGGQLQIGNDTPITLSADANDDRILSYTFPGDTIAIQQTVLTFVAGDGTEYHFFWSDLTKNTVTIDSDVANVTDVYKKSVTVYYDATYSKLSYANDGVSSSGIPSSGGTGTIRYYATGSGKSDSEGTMTKVASRTVNGHTWKDLYKVDLEEGYTTIVFSNYDMSSIDNLGGYGNSTGKLTIDASLKNPCFYADGGDSCVYSNSTGGRSGYWDEVYTIRDAEKGKSTEDDPRDVVDIKTSEFTRSPEILYVDTTFYDYYSDYELNGRNRDDYGTSTGGSQRNWVTFRQFNQALSDYYKENNISIPIYTGHFQPSYSNWNFRFSDVADTLNLYGYSSNTSSTDYGRFFSTNNSTLNVSGDANSGNGYYAYAAQGLVSSTMSNDNLMLKTTSGGTKISPHFDADFITGDNSKNAVLGEVYENVAFPFKSVDRDNNGVKYWTFNSKDTTLAMQQDTDSGYYLKDVGNQNWSKNVNSGSDTSGVTYTYGFFPFNETSTAAVASTYNYGFGTKLEFQFRLTETGTVEGYDTDGTTKVDIPITFEFSGDDDVWVFIDDQLVLDVGGSHGVVTGEIDFRDHDSSTAGRQIVSTVDKVKASAGSTTSGSDITSTHTLEETTKTEHTLTMYYMERGMWESNMSISFNFPDENQLEVEKQVDDTEVNELFKSLFDGVSLFEYTIKNQATHYGTVAASSTAVSKVIFNDSFTGDTIENVGSNVFSYKDSKSDKTDVVHWYASLSDASGSYREKRYGTIYPVSTNDGVTTENSQSYVDISNMNYLEFKYYYDTSDTPSLSNMYLQLVDTEGNIKGNITDYLSGKNYGTVNNASKKWVTVKIDLSKLVEQSGFNDKVAAIKFGYNYPQNFYLDDFIFHPLGEAAESVGFVKKQYTIPDYGSAQSGKLEIPIGASYTTTVDETIKLIGEEGHFYLQDGETITFKDQFRRGSYIYLEETQSPLYDTSWTMYENGDPVDEIIASTEGVLKISDSITGLVNVATSKVEDGRTENIISGADEDGYTIQNGNNYDGNKPSTKNAEDNTMVFRSYSQPDNASITTKLKVVYTNRINVGSLKIEKKMKYDNESLEDSYKFKIIYSNVGGVALESEPIIQEVTVKAGESITIEGIPIGTYFTVEEETPPKDTVNPDNTSYLDKVEISDPNSMIIEEGNIVKGVILEEVNDTPQISVVTFTNTKEPKISASMKKNWKDEETQYEITDNLPESITVQLQRKRADEDDSKYTFVPDYEKITVTPQQSEDGAVWTYTVSGLDKVYDYPSADDDPSNDKILWVYRFVELDVKEDGTYTVIENGKVITYSDIDYGVEYTDPNDPNEGTETDNKDPVADDEGNYATEITNVLLEEIDLKILKKATDGSALADVTFMLAPYNDTDTDKIAVRTTGADGIATFEDLVDGTYVLTEIKTASDHTLLFESIIIVINRKEETFHYCLESDYPTNYPANVQDMELVINGTAPNITPTLTLNIVNPKNIVLPPTGWNSPISPATGIVLLSIYLAICLMYRKRITKSRREGKPPGT